MDDRQGVTGREMLCHRAKDENGVFHAYERAMSRCLPLRGLPTIPGSPRSSLRPVTRRRPYSSEQDANFLPRVL